VKKTSNTVVRSSAATTSLTTASCFSFITKILQHFTDNYPDYQFIFTPEGTGHFNVTTSTYTYVFRVSVCKIFVGYMDVNFYYTEHTKRRNRANSMLGTNEVVCQRHS